MLKKAGIIVAVAATGVLAVSSFAFADTKKDNVSNKCTFGNSSGAARQGLVGGSGGLVGDLVGAVTGVTTNAATQANATNCTNVQLKDLVDADSNNKTKTSTKTTVKHSYND